MPWYIGPNYIFDCLVQWACCLYLSSSLQSLHDMFCVSLLCEYCKGGDSNMVAQPIIIDREPEWRVDRILHHPILREITQYLICFVGFSISKAVWLTADVFLMLWIYCISTKVHTELGNGLTCWQFCFILQGAMLVVIRC